ncbi:MAG: S41 family peptidase [Pseudomonadota bacterium]
MKKHLITTIILLLIPFSSFAVPPTGIITAKSLGAVEKHYLDRKDIRPRELLDAALENLQYNIPEFQIIKSSSSSITVKVGFASKNFKISPNVTLKEVPTFLFHIYKFLEANYDGDIKQDQFEPLAIDGILSKLDAHSSLLIPKIYSEFNIGTKGEFGGLGMVVGLKDGKITVISPLDDTPASKVGMRAGDRIVQIENESTINMSLTEAVNMLRGPVGTKVTIVIERGAGEKIKLEMKRAKIHIDSVKSKLISSRPSNKIGYIKIKNFQSNTDEDVAKALKKFDTGGKMTGLIIDLRNNPGGLLDQAAKICDHFLESGVIVSTVAAGNKFMDKENAHKTGTEPTYPIVILINQGSASASEIVAKTLQNNSRAIVMGENSFGKGSVQTIFDLGDNYALKLTIAKYLASGTTEIKKEGITPDIELTPLFAEKDTINIIPDEKKDYGEDSTKKKDAVKKVPTEKSKYSLSFLDKKTEKDWEKISKEEHAKEPNIADDFAVNLAIKLLTNDNIKKVPKVIEELSNEEQQKLTSALSSLNIDWSVGKKPLKAQPNLTDSLNIFNSNKSKKLESIQSGDAVNLVLTLTNNGKETLHRVIANTTSENPYFNELEFVFGTLKPGESKSWTREVKIPLAMPQQEVEIKFENKYGRNAKSAGEFSKSITLTSAPSPRFMFSYKFSGVKTNSPVPQKKNLNLKLKVSNLGPGATSDESVATLSTESPETVFIQKGRVDIPQLKPGESKSIDFSFYIQPDTKTEVAQLELILFDSKNLVSISKKIQLNLTNGKITPPESVQYQAPKITLSNIPKTSTSATLNLKGKIEDDEIVKDYYVFVGREKLVYSLFPRAKNEAVFTTTLPLEKGNNLITVIARDQHRLSSSKSFIVRLVEKDSKTIQK